MTEADRFWRFADEMVASHELVIDRPAGSRHPRLPDIVYPLDYGYLAGTSALDGDGIDCWRGSANGHQVTGVIISIDRWKQDSELKWLIGCTDVEMDQALMTHQTVNQTAMMIRRAIGD